MDRIMRPNIMGIWGSVGQQPTQHLTWHWNVLDRAAYIVVEFNINIWSSLQSDCETFLFSRKIFSSWCLVTLLLLSLNRFQPYCCSTNCMRNKLFNVRLRRLTRILYVIFDCSQDLDTISGAFYQCNG